MNVNDGPSRGRRAEARGERRQCGLTDWPTYQFVLRDLQVTDGLLNFIFIKIRRTSQLNRHGQSIPPWTEYIEKMSI